MSEAPNNRVPVLISTAVMVYIDGPSADLSPEAYAELTVKENKLREAVAAAFSEPPDEPIGCVSVHYGDQEDINFYRCPECGRWLSDPGDPGTPDGLMFGHTHDGTLYCYEHWLIASGEWPSDESL